MTSALGDVPPLRRSFSTRTTVFVVIAGSLLTLWAIGSGYYILFHDRLVAILVSRQAEMQYAYEDRIAELHSALDGAKSLAVKQSLDQEIALRDLATREAHLEDRAKELEALVEPHGRGSGPRLGALRDGNGRTDQGAGRIESLLAAVELRQRGLANALQTRTEKANERVQTALAALGLAPPVPSTAGSGGPFVPLAESEPGAQADIVALREAIQRRRQLDAVASRLPLRQPVSGPLDVTSGFGARRDPFLGKLALHTGIDLREDFGSPVDAAASGTVTIAGEEAGYGTMVEIDHGNGYATRYAHLSSVAVGVGDKVVAGSRVGEIGTSGRSTGPHLHYEIRIAGAPVDPARYLALASAMAAE